MNDQQPAAGWYPDPDDVTKQRYWDGSQWTEHRAKAMAVNYEQAQEIRDKANRRAWKVIGVVVAAGLLFWIVSATVSRFSGGPEATTAEEAPAVVDDEPEVNDAGDGCIKVPRSVLKVLGDGMPLTDGWAVRSDDYNKVWFVAGRYVNLVPVFAVNGNPSSPDTAFDGLVLSVNEDAAERTPWPYGPETPAKVSMSDDGARQAELCALGGWQ